MLPSRRGTVAKGWREWRRSNGVEWCVDPFVLQNVFIAIINQSYEKNASLFKHHKHTNPAFSVVNQAIVGFVKQKITSFADSVVKFYTGWKKEIKVYDKDGDGALDKQELADLKEKMRHDPEFQRMLKEADLDNDEQLSIEETNKLMQKIDQTMKQRLQQVHNESIDIDHPHHHPHHHHHHQDNSTPVKEQAVLINSITDDEMDEANSARGESKVKNGNNSSNNNNGKTLAAASVSFTTLKPTTSKDTITVTTTNGSPSNSSGNTNNNTAKTTTATTGGAALRPLLTASSASLKAGGGGGVEGSTVVSNQLLEQFMVQMKVLCTQVEDQQKMLLALNDKLNSLLTDPSSPQQQQLKKEL